MAIAILQHLVSFYMKFVMMELMALSFVDSKRMLVMTKMIALMINNVLKIIVSLSKELAEKIPIVKLSSTIAILKSIFAN